VGAAGYPKESLTTLQFVFNSTEGKRFLHITTGHIYKIKGNE
jgi:hypothetical protein